MISVVVIAAALAGLITAWFLRKVSIKHAWRVSLLGLAIGIAGTVMVINGTTGIRASFERRDWPSVTGVVIDSKVAGDRASHSVVIYEFSVDGKLYRDSCSMNQPSFGGRNRRREVAVKMIAAYPPGRDVKVFYDATQPEQSTLVLAAYWSDYGMSGFGTLLLAAGVCLIGLGVSRRRHSPI